MLFFHLTDILLLLLIATFSILSPFICTYLLGRRMVKDHCISKYNQQDDTSPNISIVLIAHNQAEELAQNLPAFFNQEFAHNYRVIIVTDKSDKETTDVIKRFIQSSEYTNIKDKTELYTILLPDSSRYMSRKKLAVTLGVKAATTDWIVLTEPNCMPTSKHWLTELAAHATEGKDIVLGYSILEDTAHFIQYTKWYESVHMLYHAYKGRVYGYNDSNLMFRKSVFLQNEGYRGNLEFLRGEYEFIANKYAQRDNIGIALFPKTWLRRSISTHEWINEEVFHQANKASLKGKMRYLTFYGIDMLARHIPFALLALSILYSAITSNYPMMLGGFIGLISIIGIHTYLYRRLTLSMGVDIPARKLYIFSLLQDWFKLYIKIKYLSTNKINFSSHKL